MSSSLESSSLAPTTSAQAAIGGGGAGSGATDQVPSPRSGASFAYDPIDQVSILFGGSTSGGPLNDTWSWNGHKWSRLSPAHSPSPRAGAGIAFESSRGGLLLFGGARGDQPGCSPCAGWSDETWLWNGGDWAQLHPDRSPSPRGVVGMAYDSVRHATLLHGGYTTVDAAGQFSNTGAWVGLNDTWIWTGTGWQPLAITFAPPADWGDAIAYDSAVNRLVRFGGYSPSDSDTWQTDGTSWTDYPATSGSPSYRSAPALSYDEARSVVILFGGHHNNPTDETWLWNGSKWQPVNPSHKPLARESASITYDAARKVVVLFGGMGIDAGISQKPLNDTWTWDGQDWSEADPGT